MLSEPLVKLNSVYVKVQEALLHLRGDLLVGDTGVVGKAVGGTARIFDTPAFYAQQVRQILRKFGTDAHMFMPGVGYMNGFAAGNYLESTGQTNASVDGAVGLVLDAAGSVGANLVTSASGVAGTYNGETLVDDATNANHYVQLAFASPANRTQITAKVKAGTKQWLWVYFANYTAGSVWFDLVNGVVGTQEAGVSGKITPLGGGEYEITVTKLNNTASTNGAIVATGANGSTAAYTGTNSVAFYARDISVREVTGTHASQATTANKPILRRGILNLLTQNGDFSNAAWTRTNVNILGSVQAPDGSNTASNLNFVFVSPITRLYQDTTFQSVNGTRYTFAVWMRSATPCKISIGVQRSGPADPEQAEVDVTATWQLFVFSHSGAFTGTSAVRGVIFSYGAAFNKNIEVWRPGLFQGTLTAQQILAAGGIPLTTTAPASSQYGAYAWQFDGSNDTLTGPAPFQLVDDHCVVAAVTPSIVSGNYTIFEVGDGSSTNRVASMRLNSGSINVLWNDGTTSRSAYSGTASPSESYVHSVRKVGNSFSSRKNGVAGTGSSGPLNATTSTGLTIGNRTVAASFEYWNGLIYPIIAIKGTVSDSDLRVLEKWLGSIAGVSIA